MGIILDVTGISGHKKDFFCPSPWLREGMNEIMIFDLHQTESKQVTGSKTRE